jgi:DNA-binding response OmpR family regulator
MPVVFIIAPDWTLRTALRAELRESGIDALGMDSPNDVAYARASGQLPNIVVLEATPELLDDLRIQSLLRRVPAILIASRTLNVPLPPTAAVLYRPARIADIVARINELLARHPAT